MRRTAEAALLSYGTVQFHFGTHDELVRTVIRYWADKISEALAAAAGEARGLARAWKLCQQWVRMTDQIDVVLEALVIDPRNDAQEQGARAAVLERLAHWVDETHRSLRQAQLKHELQPRIDIRAVALEVHRLLWSRGWSSALCGSEAAASGILNGVLQRLSGIAIDPAATLPPASEIALLPAAAEVEENEDREDIRFDQTWKMFLEKTDPQYHAFLRHEIMGDPRTFVRPPDVTPEDEARAEEFAKKHGRTVSRSAR
jgi:AcrR family transcriptional regulator